MPIRIPNCIATTSEAGNQSGSALTIERRRRGEEFLERERGSQVDIAETEVHRVVKDRAIVGKGVILAPLAAGVRSGGEGFPEGRVERFPAASASNRWVSTQIVTARNPISRKSSYSADVSRPHSG